MLRYFDIAGVTVRLTSDTSIKISDKMNPYLLSSVPEDVAYEISVAKCDRLPQKDRSYYQSGTSYYEVTASGKRIFLARDSFSDPYAMVEFYRNKRIDLIYLQGNENLIDNTTALFHKIGFENLLLDCNRLILHCSYILYKEKSILFSAPSETGKSTQARLWNIFYNAETINDDRAAISVSDTACFSHGIPFSGTSDICNNYSSEIGAIVILAQGKQNKISRINKTEAFLHLYSETTIHQWDKSYVEKASALLLDIIEKVPVYMLTCLPDKGAADLLHTTLIDGGVF